MNYINLNIKYLFDKENFSQDEFGAQFDLKKGVVTKYINQKTLPQIDTIQKICLHYKITLDDFINTDLSATKNQPSRLQEPEMDFKPSGLYFEKQGVRVYVEEISVFIAKNEEAAFEDRVLNNIVEKRVSKKLVEITSSKENLMKYLKS